MPLEREIKLRFASTDEARARVRALDVRVVRPRRLQRDALLDTADRALMARQSVLRVREEDDGCRLTLKGPPLPDAMKLREEHETAVADRDALLAILDSLGLRVWFRSEKYREEYAAGNAIVAIDETPVGTFVEIEGSEEDIHRTAQGLGRGPADYVTQSYRALYLEHVAATGTADADMIFTPWESA